MIPTIDETKDIIKKTEHVNIDVKETISKTIGLEMIDSDYFVSSVEGDPIFDVMELEDVEYDFLSDEYFDYLDKKINGEGIYILLGYACPDNNSDNVIEYEVVDNGEEYVDYSGVLTWNNNVLLALPEDKYYTGDMVTDYGIVVNKTGDEYTIDYSFNDNIHYGHGMGYREISSIENKLDEPLHRILIKLMSEAIIVKDDE